VKDLLEPDGCRDVCLFSLSFVCNRHASYRSPDICLFLFMLQVCYMCVAFSTFAYETLFSGRRYMR
jgi:hypothetical protein